METINIWNIMNGAQVTTALVLIAISLVYIAVKISDKTSSKSSRR